ncbi:hypothetical protein GCM10007989_35170 [Devosia pacifica]|uniref:Uncharacterized protein n=1 Tax=Devosia pacifica TaxID=1335967 RepID=A0A918SCV3_9HYPH|nr:hypothetical protein [Devosia pacifica]GHA36075.1 hypothetical protein GCM10007989_35170 [Devosia pacifica]
MGEAKTTPRPIGTLVFLMAGPILWAAHLTLIYGSQSALCGFAVGTGPSGSNTLASASVIAGTVLVLGLLLALLIWPHPVYKTLSGAKMPGDQQPLMLFVMRFLNGLSILAVLYAGVAVQLLDACADLR